MMMLLARTSPRSSGPVSKHHFHHHIRFLFSRSLHLVVHEVSDNLNDSWHILGYNGRTLNLSLPMPRSSQRPLLVVVLAFQRHLLNRVIIMHTVQIRRRILLGILLIVGNTCIEDATKRVERVKLQLICSKEGVPENRAGWSLRPHRNVLPGFSCEADISEKGRTQHTRNCSRRSGR